MQRRRFLLLALALGVSGGLAGPGAAGEQILAGVPLIRQTYNSCGPASIAQVLGYYGLQVSLAEVSRLTRPNERAYMSAQAILHFAPQVGMEARYYAGGQLGTVRDAIRHGLPLIVLQAYVPRSGPAIPHWRVVVGYSDRRQQVYLMDPLLGSVTLPYTEFGRVWAPYRGQFALLYPPQLGATVRKVIG